jgi:hypothetical protein
MAKKKGKSKPATSTEGLSAREQEVQRLHRQAKAAKELVRALKAQHKVQLKATRKLSKHARKRWRDAERALAVIHAAEASAAKRTAAAHKKSAKSKAKAAGTVTAKANKTQSKPAHKAAAKPAVRPVAAHPAASKRRARPGSEPVAEVEVVETALEPVTPLAE